MKNDYFIQTAIHIDIFGNKNLRTLFNLTLITENSQYKFGETEVTISAVLGYNEKHETLTKTGHYVVSLLNKIEENHCYKAASHYGLL